MKRVEEILYEKLAGIINFALAKKVKPDIQISNVRALNKGTIKWLKERYGIEGIVLDLDETLRHAMEDIPECNREWLKMASEELKITVLSNGWSGKSEEYLKRNGINYIRFAFKPAKRGFEKACELMGTDPSKVIMIGDDLLSDIYGGQRSGMMTAQNKSVEREDEEEER